MNCWRRWSSSESFWTEQLLFQSAKCNKKLTFSPEKSFSAANCRRGSGLFSKASKRAAIVNALDLDKFLEAFSDWSTVVIPGGVKERILLLCEREPEVKMVEPRSDSRSCDVFHGPIASRASLRNARILIVWITGMPMVNTSMKKMENANHVGGTMYWLTTLICGTYSPASQSGDAGSL